MGHHQLWCSLICYLAVSLADGAAPRPEPGWRPWWWGERCRAGGRTVAADGWRCEIPRKEKWRQKWGAHPFLVMQYMTPEVMVSKSRCKYLSVKDMGQYIICNNRMRGNNVKELVFIHNCCTFLHKMSCLCLLVLVNYSHLPTWWDEKFLHVLWVRLVVVGSNTRQLSLVTRAVCHFTLLLKHEPEVTVIPTGALHHCGWNTYYLEGVTSMMTLSIPRSPKTWQYHYLLY